MLLLVAGADFSRLGLGANPPRRITARLSVSFRPIVRLPGSLSCASACAFTNINYYIHFIENVKRFYILPIIKLLCLVWIGRDRTYDSPFSGQSLELPYHSATIHIWQVRKESNLRIMSSKPIALPLGYSPSVYSVMAASLAALLNICQ